MCRPKNYLSITSTAQPRFTSADNICPCGIVRHRLFLFIKRALINFPDRIPSFVRVKNKVELDELHLDKVRQIFLGNLNIDSQVPHHGKQAHLLFGDDIGIDRMTDRIHIPTFTWRDWTLLDPAPDARMHLFWLKTRAITIECPIKLCLDYSRLP